MESFRSRTLGYNEIHFHARELGCLARATTAHETSSEGHRKSNHRFERKRLTADPVETDVAASGIRDVSRRSASQRIDRIRPSGYAVQVLAQRESTNARDKRTAYC